MTLLFSQSVKDRLQSVLVNKDGDVMRSFSVVSQTCDHVAVDRGGQCL